MDCLGAAVVRGLDDPVELQVRLGRRRTADVVRLVGVADVDRATIGIGINRRGRDAKLPTGAHDADRDLAAIGHQDLLEELLLQPIASNGWLGVTTWPSLT